MPHGRSRSQRRRSKRSDPNARVVLLVDDGREALPDLTRALQEQGYVARHVEDLVDAPALLVPESICALLVGMRAFSQQDLDALRMCRIASPGTALVVMTAGATPAAPDVHKALEVGATAFLSWPAPAHVLRQALLSGRPRAGGSKP